MSYATDKKKFEITCNSCGKKIDANYSMQRESRYYCLDCYLQNYGRLLLDYCYKPSPRFNAMSFEKNPLYMGIELEVEASNERDYNDGDEEDYEDDEDDEYSDRDSDEHSSTYLKEQAYYIMENYPCYIKYDGSLNNCGMEIVTHPYSLKYHKKVFNWEKLLKYLKDNKFTSYENNRCGLHIHISKDFFIPEDYLKLNIFFDKDYDRMKKFAKRNKTGFCHKIGSDQTETIARRKKRTDLSGWYDHYKSLYFGNCNTIELRIFRGTLNIERFNATLDITEGLSYFIKSYSLAFFIKATKKQIWFNFISFLKNSRRYNKLLQYMQKENLLDCSLKRIPLKGEELMTKVSRKPLTEYLMTSEVRTYLQNKIIPELEYYFEDFASYEIYHREDVYYFGNNDKCLPRQFAKIIIRNSLLEAKTRYSIIKFYLECGYIVTMQDKNINKRITSIDAFALLMNVPTEKIRERLQKQEAKQLEELEAKQKKEAKAESGEALRTQIPESFLDFAITGSYLPPRGARRSNINRNYQAKFRNAIKARTIKELDKEKNKHLYFTVTKLN